MKFSKAVTPGGITVTVHRHGGWKISPLDTKQNKYYKINVDRIKLRKFFQSFGNSSSSSNSK
jgi:hypothetical protein